MSRLPVAAFVALAIATVAAFFVTQHLKVTTPLLAGFPAPAPSAINPIDGQVCKIRGPKGAVTRTSHRSMFVSFYLLNRSDDVDVYIVDDDGTIVRTLASGVHMQGGKHPVRRTFTWNGRLANGSVVPDGKYFIRVALIHQGRSVLISNNAGAEPVTVQTVPPRPRVTSVTPALIPQATGAAAVIRFTGNQGLPARVLIYRTDLPGPPRLVKSFAASGRSSARWDGTVTGGRPAPQGTYLVGLKVTDRACNTGRFPAELPPVAGSTAHAGVTVRYLAAQAPLTPVASGTSATVYVDSRQHPYRWTLTRAGVAIGAGAGAGTRAGARAGAGNGRGAGRGAAGKRGGAATAAGTVATGSSSSFILHVPLPAGAAGLYELSLRWGQHRTAVPLVTYAAHVSHPKAMVVLPALTWQGRNPVDDNGDGVADTLSAGGPIKLARPLANGLPSGFADEAAFVAHLRQAKLPFDLTTDLGLDEGIGPPLSAPRALVFAGDERWFPASLAPGLHSYIGNGGRVLSLGIDSLRRLVRVAGGRATAPSAASATDLLGAKPGAVAATHGALILVSKDGLHIFSGTSGALRGYDAHQPFEPLTAWGPLASEAGVATAQPTIIGYRTMKGIVIAIGLPGFGSSLDGNFDARQLLGQIWTVLSR